MSVARVSVIDPRHSAAWAWFARECPGATVFHSPQWAQALASAYGFQPRYYVLQTASGEVVAALPLMLVRSRLTGDRLVGLPFSDLCPPLAADAGPVAMLAAAARDEAWRLGLRYVEVRGGDPCWLEPSGFTAVNGLFVRHVLELPRDRRQLEALVHDSARRGVRKAQRLGVRVRRAGPEAMSVFYRIYRVTRARQHLVPAPYRFFQAVGEHLLDKGLGTLLLAEVEGEAVACNLLLWWGETMTYKYNVSLPDRLDARPNNLLMWATLELALEMGMGRLDMGRSDAAHEGLRRFKSLWGAVEAPLPYLYYPADALARDGRSSLGRVLRTAVRTCPQWGARALGALLYRHLG